LLAEECSGPSTSFIVAGARGKMAWKWVLTEEKYDEITARLEYCAEKFPRHITYKTGFSVFMFI
jgi:hypothetical protein